MVDWAKPVQTRDGLKVRVLATDVLGRFPVAAVVTFADGSEDLEKYTLEGRYMYADVSHEYDVVNVPEKRRLHGFVNVYPSGVFDILHRTRGEADYAADKHRLACVEVDQEYEVG